MEYAPINPGYFQQFADRREAGRLLAKALTRYRDAQPVVLALPRGGIPVGFEIAMALEAPLEPAFVRKLRAPGAPELGLGAVVDGAHPQRVLNTQIVESIRPPPGYLEREERAQLDLIAERKRRYLGDRAPEPVEGRTVIVVDDGIATGGTVRAVLKALSMSGARRKVVAIPVAPQAAIDSLADEVDDRVCLLSPADFHSVGYYYADFEQTSDEEVIELLKLAAERRHGQGEQDSG